MTGDQADEEASLAAQIRGEQAEEELQRRHPFGLATITEPEEHPAGTALPLHGTERAGLKPVLLQGWQQSVCPACDLQCGCEAGHNGHGSQAATFGLQFTG